MVAPLEGFAYSFSVCPVHTGLLLLAVGADGCVVMITVVLDGYDGHPFDVVMVVH